MGCFAHQFNRPLRLRESAGQFVENAIDQIANVGRRLV